MHHEPRRLLHDQKMLVLEDHRHGYLFRRDALLGYPRLDSLPATHPVRRNDLLAIDEQHPLLYYALNDAPAGFEPAGGQAVEAFPCLRGVHFEAVQGRGGYRRWAGKIFLTSSSSRPRTRTTLSLLEAPRTTVTSGRGIPSSAARKRSASALALPPVGG